MHPIQEVIRPVMWNGAFSPHIAKHRDYRHKTFYQHIKATGAVALGAARVVVMNPITEEEIERTTYYEVNIILHDGSTYIYLIKSTTPGPPSEEEIEEQLEEYIRKPLPNGRRLIDYLDEAEVAEIDIDQIFLPRPPQVYSGRFSIGNFVESLSRS